jgi:hypothetical protein
MKKPSKIPDTRFFYLPPNSPGLNPNGTINGLNGKLSKGALDALWTSFFNEYMYISYTELTIKVP